MGPLRILAAVAPNLLEILGLQFVGLNEYLKAEEVRLQPSQTGGPLSDGENLLACVTLKG